MIFHSNSHYLRLAVAKVELMLAALVLAMAAYLLVPAGQSARAEKARAACLANLEQIGRALQNYLKDSDNRWPSVAKLASVSPGPNPWPTLPTALKPYLAEASVFHCPADVRRLEEDSPLRQRFGRTTTYFETEGTSYEWWFGELYAGRKVGEENLSKAAGFGMGRADQPLLTDFEPFHRGDERGDYNTLNADFKPRIARSRPGRG
jgi:type II secretory pathway pseudopilin PulG